MFTYVQKTETLITIFYMKRLYNVIYLKTKSFNCEARSNMISAGITADELSRAITSFLGSGAADRSNPVVCTAVGIPEKKKFHERLISFILKGSSNKSTKRVTS